MKNPAGFAVAIIFASSFFVAGCGSSIRDLCEDRIACDGRGSVEECVTNAEEAEATADARGCGAEFSDAISCGADNSECVDGEYLASAECTSEIVALVACIDDSDETSSE